MLPAFIEGETTCFLDWTDPPVATLYTTSSVWGHIFGCYIRVKIDRRQISLTTGQLYMYDTNVYWPHTGDHGPRECYHGKDQLALNKPYIDFFFQSCFKIQQKQEIKCIAKLFFVLSLHPFF